MFLKPACFYLSLTAVKPDSTIESALNPLTLSIKAFSLFQKAIFYKVANQSATMLHLCCVKAPQPFFPPRQQSIRSNSLSHLLWSLFVSISECHSTTIFFLFFYTRQSHFTSCFFQKPSWHTESSSMSQGCSICVKIPQIYAGVESKAEAFNRIRKQGRACSAHSQLPTVLQELWQILKPHFMWHFLSIYDIKPTSSSNNCHSTQIQCKSSIKALTSIDSRACRHNEVTAGHWNCITL